MDRNPDPSRRAASEDGGPVDMSPEAIDRRLREVAQLYRLGMSLRTGRWVEGVRDGDQGRGSD